MAYGKNTHTKTGGNAPSQSKKNTLRSLTQRGISKSVALTPEEFEKLKAFGDPEDSQEMKATKLGISRSAYLRILLAGSGRGDYIAMIRSKLENYTLPTSPNTVPNFVGQK